MAPAAAASVPALVLLGVSLTSADQGLRTGGAIVGALGLVVCGLVRDMGRRLQVELWRRWGGSPTIRRLRWRQAPDPRRVERLHQRISAALGQSLPRPEDESRDPEDTDHLYEEAVAALRQRTIDRDRFPLVFEENCEYGFRRNSLGIRSIALVVAFGALVASVVLLALADGPVTSLLPRWGASGGAAIVMLAYWGLVVNEGWVRRAAETYADRLFESLDTLLVQ